MTGDDGHYRRLNDAVAEEMFGLEQAGRPVYALPETDTLDHVVKRAGLISPRGSETVFTEAVSGTLHHEEGIDLFRRHLRQARRQASMPLEVPYSLGLLVSLSMAADAMHAGEGMAANNYYGRLSGLLALDEANRGRLEHSYRRVAETLWASLNTWLEAWEGERGIPTAYALGHRYIGLPMSQALVRRGDREHLREFYVAEGLPPGYQMAPADMETVLDSWVNHEPSIFSHALRMLWRDSNARDRIVAVAVLELESWDGADLQGLTASTRVERAAQARLTALLRTFPKPSVELGLSLANPDNLDEAVAAVDTPEGVLELRCIRSGAAMLRLDSFALVDAGSLVADGLSLRVGEGAPVIRRPRRVVPLRRDELQGAFVEVERVQMGESTLVLVAEPLVPQVERLLGAVARPGWRALPADIPGLPEGWVLFRDVEVLDRYQETVRLDLQPLLPRSSATLVLSGGFSMPGRLRKWSSRQPPEVHAVVPPAASLTVKVHRGSTIGEEIEVRQIEGSVAVVPLGELGLVDGEYLVTVHEGKSTKPVATSLVRLRSADSPVQELRGRPSGLVYEPYDGPLWPLVADSPDGYPALDGARVGLEPLHVEADSDIASAEQRPRPDRRIEARPRARVGRGLGSESCMQTGMHRMNIPPALPGRPPVKSVEGECETCGLVKRYPTTAGGARRRGGVVRKVHLPLDLTTVARIPSPAENDFTVAFDALCHLGHGSWSDLSRISAQVDGSSLFADAFLRTLETLGHIDVKRDPRTLSVVEFELTPPTLVQVASGTMWLVGRSTQSLVADLQVLAEEAGLALRTETDRGVPRVLVEGDVDRFAQVFEEAGGVEDTVLERDPAVRLARSLPPLSRVVSGLHRVAVPESRSLEAWDTRSAAWVTASSLAAPGAYRLGGFASLYVLRAEEDLAHGTVAVGNAQLVKHAASGWAGDPLLQYHEASGSAVAPLGADLPGVFGRALALASGRHPIDLPKARMLQYPAVPRQLAQEVFRRLAC